MNMIPVSERQKPVSLANLLHRTTSRILQSLTLPDILTATVAEVRSFLATDRVMIYKFHSNGSGQVLAESILEQRLPSLLGLNFPADDIPAYARELFARSRMRSVVDVSKQQIGQSFVRQAETGEIILDEMQYRTVEPCHIEYLTAMGVQSSLAVPILHDQQLWGLLVSHHSEPRSTPAAELQAVQMVVDQLAVAIAQSILLEQTQAKAHRETTINRIATLLRSDPRIDLLAALAETVSALQGVGGRLYVTPTAFELQASTTGHLVQFQTTSASGQLYTCGLQPDCSEQGMATAIEQTNAWQTAFEADHPTVWAIPDTEQSTGLQWLQSICQPVSIRGILIIPLEYGQRRLGYLTIFRTTTTTETLWAGQFDPDQRQNRARQSFTAWKELKLNQIVDWRSSEIELAQALASHFAAAILHTQIHGQLELINASLEQQVQERTLQLQQTAEQQQALLEVVTKIRSSLTPETLFRTTAEEVCQLLKAERVAVYRFNPDWGGEFIHDFESTTPEWRGMLRLGENLVWNDTYLQVTQGGRYRHNETFAVDDITQAGLYQCHVDILNQFHIQAFAIAPIFVGQELWGLLAAYQHSAPRIWDASEVKFLAQTAAQLGMALQQAELLAQTRQQAEDLAQTVEELRRTQTQLIQTEKISSLGQLVAGVAHEINNPVNFIYGNLSHAHEYAEDLLNLLQSYQADYPNPSARVQAQADAIDLEFIAEDLPKLLGSMKVGADRIRQIVLSLLNFSRLDQAEKKPVDIHEGIESTLLILQHRLKAKPEHPGIEVSKHYQNLPPVECYAGQLNQVFMNILSNAIDAIEQARPSSTTTQPSQLTIRTRLGHSLDRPSIEIHITDNGPGIPDAIRTHIFDPFFTTKPIGKGTGLGLSISHQIVVEKHHGVLTCLSQPGQGTEFVIEIPIR
ncbi:GAF domain-containing protein [Pantanalinema rosaneae CENA516]|uniref:GAF domain-containing protein n=1 Tax=Pantanalinema rosaneae TaxID=1620701 RepID=UPI003D6DB5C9